MTASEQFTALRQKVFAEYSDGFHAEPDVQNGGAAQITFQALYLTALLSVAAELSIDISMDRARLHAILDEQLDTADAAAPTWG